MRKLAVVAVLAAACSGGPRLSKVTQGAPVLEVRGAVKDGPFVLGRADLERLPRHSVHGIDAKTGQEAVWEGVSVAEIVSARVEPKKGADTVVVRTANGAAIPIPLTVIRQMKPVLADRAGEARLEPPVLAWPTREQRGLETDPRAVSWWARGVVAFELAEWQRTYAAALATPVGAEDNARRGSTWFGERCVGCHKVRGVGGERGPDLTRVAARLQETRFSEVLGAHPGWVDAPGDLPGPAEAADVWSFLRAVSAATAFGAPEPEAEPDELRAESGKRDADAP